jgi:hypothetical protein
VCEVHRDGGLILARRIRCCCIVIFLAFGYYGPAFGQNSKGSVSVPKTKINKKQNKVKLKLLKPLSEKDLQKANKKALKASSGKSIQKTNDKILKNQAKAIKQGNKKAAKANKALQKMHAKAVRDSQKQARAEAAKKN